MKKILLTTSLLILLLFSCSDNDNEKQIPQSVKYNKFNYQDLEQFSTAMSDYVDNVNNQVPGTNLNTKEVVFKDVSDVLKSAGFKEEEIYVNVFKISHKIPRPDLKPGFITNSAILIVPNKELIQDPKGIRLVFNAPGAYTENKEAASLKYKSIENVFENPETTPSLAYNPLMAIHGFAMLIPDYHGFGDSHNECYFSFDKDYLCNEFIELINAGRKILKDEKYTVKDDIIISGYSLGSTSTLPLAKKLDTDPASNIKMKLVMVGSGILDNIDFAERVKKDETTGNHLVFPWMVMSNKYNKYPDLNVNDIIQKKYQDITVEYMMTGDKDVYSLLPLIPEKHSDFYAQQFINSDSITTDSEYAELYDILNHDSTTPWKNKVKIIITHSIYDITCYYEPMKKFADQSKALGGNMIFETTPGEHGLGGLYYYLRLAEELNSNK